MRLWHTELIPFIPKSQLLAQWRELNSIFVKEDNHVLINYIYEYPKEDLYIYTQIVLRKCVPAALRFVQSIRWIVILPIFVFPKTIRHTAGIIMMNI